MQGAGDIHYQQSTMLFQPQPITHREPHIVFSTDLGEEQGVPGLAYEQIDPSFPLFNPCYPLPLHNGAPMTGTAAPPQYTQQLEGQQRLSPYVNHTPFPSNVNNVSPAPPELLWSQPRHMEQPRTMSRATSLASDSSCWTTCPRSDPVGSNVSRSSSPNVNEMARWGEPLDQGTWKCAYPGCTSKSTFRRGCDLRKHYRRHNKSYFCSYAGCKQATHGGFSSAKDRSRHEAKHNPQIACEFAGCKRKFSRVDNMVSHMFECLQYMVANSSKARPFEEDTQSQTLNAERGAYILCGITTTDEVVI